MEMSLSLQQQPHHHINQLFSTAATGTGVVGDVDALLTPIQMATIPTPRIEAKPERNLWREEEMLQMMKFMLQTNSIEMLNDKTVKSERVFRNIEKLMFNVGYRKKSYMQIWTKWKFLKSTYMTSRRAGVVPKMIPYSIYQVLHEILSSASNQNTSVASSNGGSVDEDNSNSGRLIISNVEAGSVPNGVGKAGKKSMGVITPVANGNPPIDDDTNGFGMAHPIFGFRLGMVKQEPVDAGYETPINGALSEHDPLDDVTANSSCSPVPNTTPVQPEIKQELVEPYSPQQPQLCISPQPSPVQISPAPAAVLESHETSMPPLRIAPFAKASQITFQHEYDRSPPPLSRPQQRSQTHRHYTRHSQGTLTVNNRNTMPRMLLPKPVAQPHQQHQQRLISTTATSTPIRIPKDITIHHTRPSTGAGMVRPKSQVSMRKLTAYPSQAQHIETVLPDIDSHILLQHQKQRQIAAMNYDQKASTSSQIPSATEASDAATTAAMMNRKRRLQQLPYANARPVKMVKSTVNNYQDHVQQPEYENNNSDQYLADESLLFDPTPDRQKQQQKMKQQFRPYKQQPLPQKNKPKKKADDSFEAALKDLGKSLRGIQRELIDDFFEKQMEMAREEHEFQSKQDALLMAAFEEQTHLIMKSAKKLLGIDIPLIKTTTVKDVDPNKTDKAETEADASIKAKPSDDCVELDADNRNDVKAEDRECNTDPDHEDQDQCKDDLEENKTQLEDLSSSDDDDDGEEDDNDGMDEDQEVEDQEGDEDTDGEHDADDDCAMQEFDEQEDDEGDPHDNYNQHDFDHDDTNDDDNDDNDENEYDDDIPADEPSADPIELASSELVED